jgi:acetate kinase
MERPVPDLDVLVINAGSSSLKVSRRPLGHAVTVERIGPAATWRGDAELPPAPSMRDHASALHAVLQVLDERASLAGVVAVGHRVVHGGERYAAPVRIDDGVVADVRALVHLAPLHNPANLAALEAAREQLPAVPHVAVFDTAFHASLAPRSYRYAVPEAWYAEHGVRRYGFHGPSHDGVTRRAAEMLGRARDTLRIVSLHLGNGASAAAVDRGRSVETSMGFTPLDGLVMGTRPGQIDPGVLLHMLRGGMDVSELERVLNHESGLKGLSGGRSNDVRDLRAAEAAGDEAAALALDVFAYRVRTALGACVFAMGGVDAIVFTGGIGEHDAATRAAALGGLERLGIVVDDARNARHGPRISPDDATVAVMVVATDEDGVIADATRALVAAPAARS